jgi:hypothetical protein
MSSDNEMTFEESFEADLKKAAADGPVDAEKAVADILAIIEDIYKLQGRI